MSVTDEIIREHEEKKENQRENQLKWQHFLLSAFLVLAGIVFITNSQINITFLCRFFAIVFCLTGVISIISYCVRDVSTGYARLDLVYGIMSIFAALVFYTKQDVIGIYFPVIIGFMLFCDGVVKLQHSIDMKRLDRKMKTVTEMWLVVMIFALICITAGVVTVYMDPDQTRKLFIFVGIALIVSGLSDVFTQIVFSKKVKAFKSGDFIKEEEKTEDKPEEKPAEEEGKKSEEAPENKEEQDDAGRSETPEEETENGADPIS